MNTLRLYTIALTCSLHAMTACVEEPPATGRDSGRGDSGVSNSMDGSTGDRPIPSGDVMGDVPVNARGPCGPMGRCDNDARCVAGLCIPWARGEFDSMCTRTVGMGTLRPTLQCATGRPPAGDPYPMSIGVEHTPVVADLGVRMDADSPTRPSIVVIETTGFRMRNGGVNTYGVMRFYDGATCQHQGTFAAGDELLTAHVTPAIGDLDGDGTLEVVAALEAGGIAAYRFDNAARRIVRVWKSRGVGGAVDGTASTTYTWAAISLADLDDDGRPEIVFEQSVYDSTGQLISTIPGYTQHIETSAPPVIADVDQDNELEIVEGFGVFRFDRATRTVVREAYSMPGLPTAYVGVANVQDIPGDPPNRPELVLVRNGTVALAKISGEILWQHSMGASGMFLVGGPPTIADLNGDGSPDIGVAFGGAYVAIRGDGMILWERPSQDRSSARTGSSVFDFNGDGRAEVVYSDECFTRVYDGRTGDVVFSQPRSSSTWTENDVVVDVDGDYAAEILSPSSGSCATDAALMCPSIDPIHRGAACAMDADCPGIPCDSGFCRCTMDAQCGEGSSCVEPLAGTPGMGRVCRSTRRGCEPGVRVYRDARDRWVPTRPIWNQHAYSITNVEDNGRIPRTSMTRRNWEVRGFNNFMQNESRDPSMVPGADVTAARLTAMCGMGSTILRADVCNRGRVLLDRGVELIFRLQNDRRELCRLRTNEPIAPGACTPVECMAPIPARGIFEAVVNPDQTLGECKTDNNLASGEADCIG